MTSAPHRPVISVMLPVVVQPGDADAEPVATHRSERSLSGISLAAWAIAARSIRGGRPRRGLCPPARGQLCPC
jgi:hypothetical protein